MKPIAVSVNAVDSRCSLPKMPSRGIRRLSPEEANISARSYSIQIPHTSRIRRHGDRFHAPRQALIFRCALIEYSTSSPPKPSRMHRPCLLSSIPARRFFYTAITGITTEDTIIYYSADECLAIIEEPLNRLEKCNTPSLSFEYT